MTQESTPPRVLYSTTEVAEMCGVSSSAVRKWCADGRIHAIRMGDTGDWRIPAATVDQLREGATA
jgi:excisionase family DNA binding protein